MEKSELGRIGVLAGGWSGERSISLDSGHAVQSALRAMKRDSTADEIERLICHVRRTVLARTGVELLSEVHIIGEKRDGKE